MPDPRRHTPWFYGARAIAIALCLFPRALRLRAAGILSVVLAMVVHRLLPAKKTHGLQNTREFLFERITEHFHQMGVSYDVPMQIRCDEPLRDALKGGALVVLTHDKLNALILRTVHDLDARPLCLATFTEFNVHGTRTPADAIHADRALLKVRTALRDGRAVLARIDWREMDPRAIHFPTVLGNVAFSDQLITVARRIGMPVVFTSVHLSDSGSLIGTVEVQRESIQSTVGAFIEFVQRDTAFWHGPREPQAASNVESRA